MTVLVSAELFAPVSPGVELCYQTFGNPDDDPLLLVMGLGGPMTWWDSELCSMLAEAGFFVVRFDNRDTGRSTRVEGRVSRRALVQAFLGRGGKAPYTLDDMAGDAFGLMDHLGWDSAHVAGVSMGGMIVQTMATGPPPAGALDDLDHVHDRQAVGGLAAPRAAAADDRQPRPGSRGLRRLLGQDLEADRLAGLSPGRRRGAQPRRGDLRPRCLGQRRDAADAGDPDPAEPLAAVVVRCGCRPRSCTGARTRWCTSPGAEPPHAPSPAPSSSSSTAWATTCPGTCSGPSPP